MNSRIKIFLCILFALTVVNGSTISVVKAGKELSEKIRVLDGPGGTYISARDISKALTSRDPFYSQERLKMVLYFGNDRIKISAETGYVLVNESIYQMPVAVKRLKNDLYLPAEAFFELLKKTTLPGLTFDSRRSILDLDIIDYNITGLTIEDKANGTILRIHSNEKFSDGNIETFNNSNGWFYVTVRGGLPDTTEINKTETRGIIQRIAIDQIGESTQLAFQLRSSIEGHEFFQGRDPNEIVVTLRAPASKSAERIKSVKKLWSLDRIVIDAGHGGKDGGTVGRYGTKEKEITLDIAKRIGRLLEKNTKIEVVYTRDEDVFIPLWKRTKIANEKNGKVFVSIHVNANPNKKVSGFETFLLRPGKTEDAIEVASRENAAIQLEDTKSKKYKKLSGESLIMATMAQSMFMKESESLASTIQEELHKVLPTPDRGVKQAGFYVLIGASMPNVLVEVGFLSNANEERRLKKSAYRQQVAQAVYRAILKFKNSREKLLAEG